MIKTTNKMYTKTIKYPFGSCEIGVWEIDKSKYKSVSAMRIKAGTVFVYGRSEYVKLANTYGGCFAAKVDTAAGSFNTRKRGCRDGIYNWKNSALREEVHDEDRFAFFEEIAVTDLLWFDRDLTTADGDDYFGTCKDLVSILTLDEYKKYGRLLPDTKEEIIDPDTGELTKTAFTRELLITASSRYGGLCNVVHPEKEIDQDLLFFEPAQYRKVIVLRGDVKVLVEKEG